MGIQVPPWSGLSVLSICSQDSMLNEGAMNYYVTGTQIPTLYVLCHMEIIETSASAVPLHFVLVHSYHILSSLRVFPVTALFMPFPHGFPICYTTIEPAPSTSPSQKPSMPGRILLLFPVPSLLLGPVSLGNFQGACFSNELLV